MVYCAMIGANLDINKTEYKSDSKYKLYLHIL